MLHVVGVESPPPAQLQTRPHGWKGVPFLPTKARAGLISSLAPHASRSLPPRAWKREALLLSASEL